MIKPDFSIEIPAELGRVHFAGIGGSGMSGIARLFAQAGMAVTGSDSAESKTTQAMRDLGIPVTIGHAAENLGSADTLVITGALWEDNAEYLAAIERGMPILHRSQALAWLIAGKRLVSVAGAHGKTTSTGMLVTGLLGIGAEPSFVNGGVIAEIGASSAFGADDTFVVEADESDGSFQLYDTAIALITNVDADHLDHYGSQEAFTRAFVEFADAATELVVISADDPGALAVRAAMTHPHVVTFGEHPDADVRVENVRLDGLVGFDLVVGEQRHSVRLAVPGVHNALNAAGAAAVMIGLGFDAGASIEAIARFGGTQRRFELHGVVGGVSVYDDYAHHPTEVAAALSAARTVNPDGRIIAVHQPHLYSRTQTFAGEFAEVLEDHAEHTIVLAVCGAREDPVPGVTGELVSARFRDPAHVDYIDEWQAAAEHLATIVRPGDFVITLGCGDVYRMIPQILGELERSQESR